MSVRRTEGDFIESLSEAIKQTDPQLERVRMDIRNLLAREEEPQEEYIEEILGEIAYGAQNSMNGIRRIRLLRDNFYTKIQVRRGAADQPDDEHPIIKQFILGNGEVELNPEELQLARSLIDSANYSTQNQQE